MTDEPSPNLLALASELGDRVSSLLADCLPQAPTMELTTKGTRASLAPEGQTEKRGGVPLMAGGFPLAWLRLDFLCRLDSTQKYLAIDKSKMWIVADVDSTPIFRFEYHYEADWVPHSHIQVHGERGALAHLLSQTQHSRPHNMSALHLPTGGSRFRPNLEDVIQFLILDCQFDRLPSWREAVHRERALWRRIQTRAVTRAMPEEACAELEDMGYRVMPPPGGHLSPKSKTLEAW